MGKPVLLDLFCGPGGAARGYAEAGFDVVGVDHVPQDRYPYEFILADAMSFPLAGYDFIHASPPCQLFSKALAKADKRKAAHVDLLTPTRERLVAHGAPWVIENVPRSPMRVDLELCGSMFGLTVDIFSDQTAELRRHRWFEFGGGASVPVQPPCDHHYPVITVYGRGGQFQAARTTHAERSEAMGIDWMRTRELGQAIPPAYTRYIGAAQL